MSAIIFLLISLVVSFHGQSAALRVLTDLERCLDLCQTYSCQNDRNIRDGCNEMFSCAHGCKLRQLGVVKGTCQDLCRRNDVNAPAIGSRLTNGQSRCEPNVSGWKFDLCRECNRDGCTPRPQVWECEQGCNFYKDTEAPKQEGESCGPCLCPPTYSAGVCAEGLTCERDERLPDAPGICTRPVEDCSRYELDSPVCSREIDPVCAGGKLYNNLCLYEWAKKRAECATGQTFPNVGDIRECTGYCSRDEIDNVCSCTREYVPVCAGGELYNNLCLYECAKKEAECAPVARATGRGFPNVFPPDSNGQCFHPDSNGRPSAINCRDDEEHLDGDTLCCRKKSDHSIVYCA